MIMMINSHARSSDKKGENKNPNFILIISIRQQI